MKLIISSVVVLFFTFIFLNIFGIFMGRFDITGECSYTPSSIENTIAYGYTMGCFWRGTPRPGTKEFIPKFKVGDCIRDVYLGNEFEPPEIYGPFREVTKIGELGYLTISGPMTRYIRFYSEKEYSRVDCL